MISQERILTLSANGGSYFNYFFTPLGDNNIFTGIGGDQLGVELSGHSGNDYTRYSVAMVSSNNGVTGLPRTTRTTSTPISTNLSTCRDSACRELESMGTSVSLQHIFKPTEGSRFPGPVPAIGASIEPELTGSGMWASSISKLSYMHGLDNVFLGNSVPANQPQALPLGAAGPTWNGGFVEAHYTYNPRFILTGRYELVRMSRQANPNIRSDTGNLDSWALGYRWYPIMNPRAGLAWVQEYGRILMRAPRQFLEKTT